MLLLWLAMAYYRTWLDMDVSLSVQAHVHSRGDTDGVSLQGHRDRRRVGPDAWDEG